MLKGETNSVFKLICRKSGPSFLVQEVNQQTKRCFKGDFQDFLTLIWNGKLKQRKILYMLFSLALLSCCDRYNFIPYPNYYCCLVSVVGTIYFRSYVLLSENNKTALTVVDHTLRKGIRNNFSCISFQCNLKASAFGPFDKQCNLLGYSLNYEKQTNYFRGLWGCYLVSACCLY